MRVDVAMYDLQTTHDDVYTDFIDLRLVDNPEYEATRLCDRIMEQVREWIKENKDE